MSRAGGGAAGIDLIRLAITAALFDRGFEWKAHAHHRPGDLGRRLRSAGFTTEPEEAVMVARIQDLPADIALPEGVRLLPVTDPAGVDLVMDLHEQAFGSAPAAPVCDSGAGLRQRLLGQLTQDSKTGSMVVALARDLPVCSARMELNPGTDFAGLWDGGTLTAWRGRGVYRALVAHRARIAAGLGYRCLQVDATDRNRPILQRLGFAILSTATPYVYPPQQDDNEA
ncbi:GNAT family N-acetyltransferase [Kitasatospora indigofera]|uniref:GNAT family N-acetyltransferase n=1 Tax=Kitasatospora indigofera TaxID=67307 RepID=UPI0036587C4A